MMHQEPREMADEMLYFREVISECLVLVELCEDCLEHDLNGKDSKLRVLLGCLNGHIWQLNDDFPFRLANLRKSLGAIDADSGPADVDQLCT